MKFNKSSQLLLVSAASLLAAGIITACGTNTVDFVFVASSRAAGSNSYGEIDVFEINSVSGYMRQIHTSPFPSGGRNPVAETVSSDNTTLYVVNQDDSSIVQFLIGSDGKLYPQNTYDTTGNYSPTGTESPVGIFPLAVAVNGTNLFVVNTYQPLPTCSSADPCTGSVGVYPILTNTEAQALTPPEIADSLGTPVINTSAGGNYWPLTLPSSPNDVLEPTAISVLTSGAYAYVTANDASVTPNAGYVFGFWVVPAGTSASAPAKIPASATCPAPSTSPAPPPPAGETADPGGTLCPLNSGAPLLGGPFTVGTCPTAYLNAPFVAGTCAYAIASDSSSSYVYLTDVANSKVLGFSVASATGLLTPLAGSPYPAGNQPSAIVVDPKFPYVFVANALDGSVTTYSISSGELSRAGTFAAGIQPVAIGIDPSANHFLFTANFLGNNVSDFELSTTAGSLTNAQRSPYTANAQPTAVAAIPHGSSQK